MALSDRCPVRVKFHAAGEQGEATLNASSCAELLEQVNSSLQRHAGWWNLLPRCRATNRSSHPRQPDGRHLATLRMLRAWPWSWAQTAL